MKQWVGFRPTLKKGLKVRSRFLQWRSGSRAPQTGKAGEMPAFFFEAHPEAYDLTST